MKGEVDILTRLERLEGEKRDQMLAKSLTSVVWDMNGVGRVLLISGSVDGFDVDDLRAHTNYTGGYHEDHYVIEMFWEVIQNLSLANQRKILKFATGCSRGPLLGFKYLEPTFCIQRTAGNASEEALDRLPTSATCMNLLKLPPYRSKQQMEQKLLYAINSDAGFDLS
ncbi:hypothetical protein Pfo_025907 [Paulownia fortunei]|nr:hypothetical protein Pfo_025907 [Paulownia fortunei]